MSRDELTQVLERMRDDGAELQWYRKLVHEIGFSHEPETGPWVVNAASREAFAAWCREQVQDMGRDRSWILAMAEALGTGSGFRIPLVPDVQAFRDLFAAVAEKAHEAARREAFDKAEQRLRRAVGEEPDAGIRGGLATAIGQVCELRAIPEREEGREPQGGSLCPKCGAPIGYCRDGCARDVEERERKKADELAGIEPLTERQRREIEIIAGRVFRAMLDDVRDSETIGQWVQRMKGGGK